LKFGLLANTRKELFWKALPNLLKWFKNKGVSVIISNRIAQDAASLPGTFPLVAEEELPHYCDMILAIGGDGTILSTVHLIGDRATPVLGINVGGLGFLTEIPLENFMEEFEKILQGKYRIEERLMLRGTINDNPEPLYALNEILIDKGSSVRVIQIEVEVEGHFLNSYIADGILVSTPTGSTGYSLSSGGPIVVPSTNVLVINPICPHSLTNRPTVIPADATIKAIIRTENPEFIIAADGRDVHYCKTRTHLTVEKAPYCAHLVKPLHSNFFHLLHSKLNWGKDFRDKTRWSHDS
jgi:NAD+ kinase